MQDVELSGHAESMLGMNPKRSRTVVLVGQPCDSLLVFFDESRECQVADILNRYSRAYSGGILLAES